MYALGRISLEIDADDRAVEWLDQVIAADAEHFAAHVDLVESLTESGQSARVALHADKALMLLSKMR